MHNTNFGQNEIMMHPKLFIAFVPFMITTVASSQTAVRGAIQNTGNQTAVSSANISQSNSNLKIDSLFSKYNTNTPGVALAVVKNGRIVFEKGYGMANLENNVPVTSQSVFHIASVSKQFTAFVIYLLENEGKISFEDDVRKYFPELPDYGTPIKIKHLLAHTSGLRDQWAILTLAGWRMDDNITTEQILKLVIRQKNTNFKPGTEFSYSNTGYTLLGELVHQITGKTLAKYAAEKIFTPLGMTKTQFNMDNRKIVKGRVYSYEINDGEYINKGLNYSNIGATGLLTTVEDLSKWALNFENPIVGTRKLIERFNEPSYLDDGKKIVSNIIEGDTLFHAKGQLLRNYRGVNMIKHGINGYSEPIGFITKLRIDTFTVETDPNRFGKYKPRYGKSISLSVLQLCT